MKRNNNLAIALILMLLLIALSNAALWIISEQARDTQVTLYKNRLLKYEETLNDLTNAERELQDAKANCPKPR